MNATPLQMTLSTTTLRLLTLVGWLAWSMTAVAQDDASKPAEEKEKENTFTVDLDFLTRGELRYGGLTDNKQKIDKPSSFLLERTRVVLGYERKYIQANVTIQHAGIWGQEGRGAFNLNEAWVKLTSKQGLFAQVGRQAFAYDDERIIGPNDWAVASLSHDAVKVGYEGYWHKAHAIFSDNQNSMADELGGTYYKDGAMPYKMMQTVWYHYDVPVFPLGASLLFMNIGMQAGAKDTDTERTEWQQLVGAYVRFAPEKWSLEGSYYRQMGHDEHGLKINAWMASALATLSPKPTYGFMAGYDYLSGDPFFFVPATGNLGLVRQTEIQGFNPVYGSHHKFYGAMDFFYMSAYYGGFTPGLQNAFAGGHVSPVKGLDVSATYHFMATATKLKDMSKVLGHQVEVEVSYSFLKFCTLAAGYTYMHGSEAMERLRRSTEKRHLHWGWLKLSVSPRVFYVKW